jgi:hypothetical protein
MLAAWVVALVVCVTGAALAWSLLAGHATGRRRALYATACAPALGLGLASLQLYFAKVLGLGRPGLVAYLLLAACLLVLLRGRRWWRSRAAGSPSPGRGPETVAAADRAQAPAVPKEPLLLRLGAWTAALLSLGVALVSNRVTARAWPEGTWDAVAIWNVKARFLFRGFEQVPQLLKLVDATAHPNYPLLLPGAVAAQWSFAGGEQLATGHLTCLLVVLGLGLLVAAVVADAGWPALGAAAAALVWGNQMLLKWASAQVADVLVAYLFFGALAVLASHLRGGLGPPLPPLLGGAFVGLLGWSKNEGVVMAAILLGLAVLWLLAERTEWSAFGARVRRVVLPVVCSALPGALALLSFKLVWAPESGLDTFLQGSPWQRVSSLERWWIPVREIVKRLIPLGAGAGWSVVWPTLLGGVALLAALLHRRSPPALLYWAAAILSVIASWVPIYVVTPYGQMWHIQSSIDRLYLQVFPAAVAALLLGLAFVLLRPASGAGATESPPPPAAGRRISAGAWVALLLAAGVVVKGYVAASWLPRIWLFADELVYLTTAWDLAHWGAAAGTHPDFLLYPPLTSAMVAPLLWIGVPGPRVYPLALLLFHGALTSAVLAAWLTLRQLFGAGSRLLVGFLVLGPPAYTALVLMSEPLFVSCYMWYLYALVRLLGERRWRWSLLAGVLLAAAVLTRAVAPLIVGSSLLVAAFDFWRTRDWRTARRMAVTLAIPSLVYLGWQPVAAALRVAGNLQTPPSFWLALVHLFLPESLFETARRVVAQVGYVSFSTYGFALPAALVTLAWSRRRPSPQEAIARSLTLHVLTFLAAMCLLAAVFMFAGHLISELPRWHMYGRYVEFFAMPLVVLAWGVLWIRRLDLTVTDRAWIVIAAVLLNAVLLASVPRRFFVESIALDQVAPNSLGLAWLFAVLEVTSVDARWLLVPLAAFLVWGLSSRSRLRWVAGSVLVALAVANFVLAVRATSRQSIGSAVHGSLISDALRAQPELLAAGLCIDYPRGADPEAHYVYRAIADHLGKVLVVVDPEPAAYPMAILTDRELPRPVLMSWPETRYRIYGAAAPPPR